jgi:hypothetical protein
VIEWLRYRVTPHRVTGFEGWFGIGPVFSPSPARQVVGFSIAFGKRSIAFHRKLF